MYKNKEKEQAPRSWSSVTAALFRQQVRWSPSRIRAINCRTVTAKYTLAPPNSFTAAENTQRHCPLTKLDTMQQKYKNSYLDQDYFKCLLLTYSSCICTTHVGHKWTGIVHELWKHSEHIKHKWPFKMLFQHLPTQARCMALKHLLCSLSAVHLPSALQTQNARQITHK